MDRLSLLLLLVSLALVAMVLRSLRREHLRVEHSVSWLLAGMALLALSVSPAALGAAAGWMGLTEPAAALMPAILVVFIVVVYRFSRVVSELKDMNITLVQRVAILEFQMGRKDGEDQ